MRFLLTFVFLFFLQQSVLYAETKQLTPDKQYLLTTLEIIKKLQTQHFEKKSIDDALSHSLLDNYLDAIDGNHQTFLQKDIHDFTNLYNKTLDDSLKKGDVSPAYTIFNIYRNRAISQLEKTIVNLPNIIKSFDFSKDETIQLDRSKANWPVSQQEADELLIKRIKAATLNLRLSNKDPEKILDLLTKRYKNQLDQLKKMNGEDVFQLYINSFTQLYDPHTNYMSPAISDNFDIDMSLKLEGIGAMLKLEDEYTTVKELVHAGPAEKQGELQPSDRIIGVAQGANGEMVDVIGWRLDDVVDLIRGKKGTIVRLEVIPSNAISDDETKVITITRDEVQLEEQSVQKAMLDIKDQNGITRKIGVLDIPAFYIDFEALRNRDPNFKSTTRDTAQLLSELIQEGAEGIIIDLRNNGGGSLREANQLTSLFIDHGPSVQIRMADQRIYSEEKKSYGNYYQGPLIVLTNRMSASASEIFAGAMQDYQRAIIVGSQTFGKGTVQSLTPLNHGKLKITESKFYRISGESTQNRGVIPDIVLPEIYDSSIIGESSLNHAMQWDKITPVPHKTYSDFTPVIAPLAQLSKQRASNDPDFIYLNKRIAYEKTLDYKGISLNEKKRLNERKKDQEFQLQLLNKKRIAKGEKPLKNLENNELDEDGNADKETKDSIANKIDKSDPYLIEAANILLDAEALIRQPRLTK